MHISIVFPAYNEEENIVQAVQDALDYLKNTDGEVIVVNDGSVDATGSLIDQLSRQHPGKVRAIHHPKNLGYAPTLRDGFLAAKGNWIFYSDSDNQFIIKEIDLLFEVSTGTDIVAGYRKNRQDPLLRKFAAWGYNRMVGFAYGTPVRDIDCAFKLFHRNVFDRIQIRSTGFLVDAEILVKAVDLKMTIREVGVTHLPRLKGKSKVRFHHVLETLRGFSGLKKNFEPYHEDLNRRWLHPRTGPAQLADRAIQQIEERIN